MNDDTLRRVLFDIASSHPALNAETIFSPFPRNRLLEPALCESCHDVVVERGETCEECASDADPTPWCDHCGAMQKRQCRCGPIAENE
jgi:hypothetical protein